MGVPSRFDATLFVLCGFLIVIACLVILVLVMYWCHRRRRSKYQNLDKNKPETSTTSEPPRDEYGEAVEVQRQRIVIKVVRDSRPVSLWDSNGELGPGLLTNKEAVKAGVLIPHRGVYRNVVTGEEQPVADAISNGLIQVEFEPIPH